MVKRDANGGTLYWIQKGFGKVEVTPMEGAAYSAAQATQDLQKNARVTNQMAETNYWTEFNNAQANVYASRPIPRIPPKPQMVVVTDPVMDEDGGVTAGVQSSVEWVPPFPDLKPNMVWKSGATSATAEPIVVQA